MKNLILFSFLCISFSGMSQTKYEQGMHKAFDLWQNEKPWEAANLFERIANAEPDNWLPAFYVAQINIINSFSEKDPEKLNTQLNKAQEFLNSAKGLSPNNAEILVLEAQWYTAWVVFDGQKYGMQYAGKVSELYQKAMKLAPENPRVVLGKTEWDMGTARYFGQPVDEFCNELKRAVILFDSFSPEGEFHPQGGKEYAEKVVASNCN
ncbi:MAG: hypothetical protein CL605_08970 [Altibacter sp.]|uniref:tetratricopeptide repeat protein n=1 Tax=Altibacter sp. TaxID=2024823 RepID=UPI000C9336E1|nr:hypothetical protein [Altibacter sp.]MAP55018.1 hypothetical protein [Altibacter sp.]